MDDGCQVGKHRPDNSQITMATVKQNPGLNHLSYFANLILSTAISEYLKGEKYLPLSAFRDMNIPEEDISKAINELVGTGTLTTDGIVDGLDEDGEPIMIETTKTAGINLEQISLVVGFAGNNQATLPTGTTEPTIEYFGTHDVRIGHALYRAVITKAESGDAVLNIDRYTLDALDSGDAFLRVRHCQVDQEFPTAKEACEWFREDYIIEKTLDSLDQLAAPDGRVYELVEQFEDTGFYHVIFRSETEEGEVARLDCSAGENAAYSLWEEKLDEFFPAEPFTLETAEPTAEMVVETFEMLFEFDVKIGESAFSVTVERSNLQDEFQKFTAVYFNEGGERKELMEALPRTTTQAKAKKAAAEWLTGVFTN